MGLRETLQGAFERANQKRTALLEQRQKLDGQLVSLEAAARLADTDSTAARAGVEAATAKQNELLQHYNRLTDPAAKRALAPEIQHLAIGRQQAQAEFDHALGESRRMRSVLV